MNCRELQFQQCIKKASETQGSSHSLLRRACVSLVSPLCSGGAESTSSMADPASLPLAAVSVSASNSRHSTRKRISVTQPDKTEAKRPRTRSQDTAASNESSTSKRGKNKPAPSNSFDGATTRNSLQNSRHACDKVQATQNVVANNKVHNNHQNSSVPIRNNKGSVSLLETGSIELQRRTGSKRPQSVGSSTSGETTSETSTKTKKPSKVEAGTSRWDVTSSKKARTKGRETRSIDGEVSLHKYPLRSQVRLSAAENPDRTIPDEQLDHKASATNKKKHKVIIIFYFLYE